MGEEKEFWLMMYAVFGVLTTVAYMVSSAVFMLSAVAASRNFHNRIFSSVLKGSVNLFFDVQVQNKGVQLGCRGVGDTASATALFCLLVALRICMHTFLTLYVYSPLAAF